ncbi:hypothetical protein Ancab_029115 [Ancistrocladus abbreviatus]
MNKIQVGNQLIEHPDLSLFTVALFDVIWHTRNKCVYESNMFSFDDVRHKVIKSLEDFRMVLKEDLQTAENRAKKQSESLKIGTNDIDAIITCDASVDDNGSFITMIIRDGQQRFIQATVKSCGIISPSVA